jgi:RHS repeat-associated protein
MPDRGSNAYLYGFNGMLKDDNLKGNGNSYDFGARIYDSRLGRWLSRDPLEFEMAASSTYSFSFNCPMFYIDYTGEKPTAYEAALMAQHVYDGTGAEELAKTGWKVSTEKFGLSAKDLADNNGEEGFKSQVYERTVNGVTEYAYVTAGTDDWEDIKEDIKAGTGNTKQYKKSIKNAKKISSKAGEKELTFIGHSLGGGMAAANAMATNRQAITFNPMGMTTILKAKLGILNVNSDGLVTNYIIFGEILYDAQHIILGIGYEGEIVYLTDGSVFVPIPSYHLYAILRAHTIGRVIEELKDEGYDNDTDQFTIMLNEIIVNSNSIQNEENQNSEQEQNCGTEECCEEE